MSDKHTKPAPAKPLSLDARKATLAKIAAGAPAKVRRGINLIDLREPTTAERAMGNELAACAKRGAKAA